MMHWRVEKIISVANELAEYGSSAASTGEIIAACFVLNRMDLLPGGMDVLDAWERLDDWQLDVKRVRSHFMEYIKVA